MTWDPKTEPLEIIELDWILDNIYPDDVSYYLEEVEGCADFPINNNRDYWDVVKLGMLTEHKDVLYDVFCRVGQGDFGSPEFSDNPIRIAYDVCLDGHHRIISAWMWNLDKVIGVIETSSEWIS